MSPLALEAEAEAADWKSEEIVGVPEMELGTVGD